MITSYAKMRAQETKYNTPYLIEKKSELKILNARIYEVGKKIEELSQVQARIQIRNENKKGSKESKVWQRYIRNAAENRDLPNCSHKIRRTFGQTNREMRKVNQSHQLEYNRLKDEKTKIKAEIDYEKRRIDSGKKNLRA